MDTTGIHAPKGDVDVNTGRYSLPPGLPPVLPQMCMERPYNATAEEVLTYHQASERTMEG